jgi:hypothetical protein
MIEGEHPTAAEHQSRAAVADVRAVEEVHLLLNIDLVRVEIGEEAQRVVDLLDVLLDESLGTETRPAVERSAAHPPHVAVYALVQRKQQAGVIVAHAQAAQAIQPHADFRVIVLAALIHIAPALGAAGLVMRDRRFGPFAVAATRCPYSSRAFSVCATTYHLYLRAACRHHCQCRITHRSALTI